MNFPPPSERQARLFWLSVTALAVGLLLALILGGFWALGWAAKQLSAVVLPLSVAGIIACLLDPVCDFLERRGVPRTRAILLVFFLVVMLVLILAATVVPQLVVETNALAKKAPKLIEKVHTDIGEWLATSAWGEKAKSAWEEKGDDFADWLVSVVPKALLWIAQRLGQAVHWLGLIAGFALVPVYVFYFLLEKKGITSHWSDYLPLPEGKAKDEVVFVLKAIQDCLIVFFRGQVLVAMCDAVLLSLGLWAVGLDYALVIGVVAGFLCIIPYLGFMVSVAPAIALAAAQSGNWKLPALVLAVFVLVLKAESLFIAPKIIGDRVGLHPLTIIIAVMTGTSLLGGLVGGLLAIPITAVLRTLMFRYVWKKPEGGRSAGKAEGA